MLAAILIGMVLALGGGALFILNRLDQHLRAPKTQPGRREDFVTREQLQEELKSWGQQTQWLLDEWYEKFSTLHARSEKAVQRARKREGGEQPLTNGHAHVGPSESSPRPSVLHHRKPWSV